MSEQNNKSADKASSRISSQSKSNDSNGNIPEVDTKNRTTTATNIIPDEVPRRDGPGGN